MRNGAIKPIAYVQGDATKPQGTDRRLIVHCVNDQGLWGRGFVLSLRKTWPRAEKAYRSWSSSPPDEITGPRELGQVQFVEVQTDEPKIWVANLVGQHGVGRDSKGLPPIRYAAIEQGLVHVRCFAAKHRASVHMPRMGAGLAGGQWSQIEPLIEQELMIQGIVVTVYDLP